MTETLTPALTEAEIDDRLVALVKELDHVSFVNIQDHMEKYINVKGGMAMELAPNVVIWVGMSTELNDAIKRCVDAKRIFLHPTVTLVYHADGRLPNLPVALRPRPKGYTSPHWLPVVFRAVPAKKTKKK